MYKKTFALAFALILFNLFCLAPIKSIGAESENQTQLSAQTELTPLDILILDLRDVKNLIEEGNNKTAIVILKSAGKEVRKVSEFDAKTKKITSQRIKKGIALLKQNKSDEALELVQIGIDELVEAGFADPSDFE